MNASPAVDKEICPGIFRHKAAQNTATKCDRLPDIPGHFKNLKTIKKLS